MELLSALFPGLAESDEEGIPIWPDLDSPWTIFSRGEGGIISQIEEKIGRGGVFVHPSAIIGEYVEIEGPCYIGPQAEIRHAAFLRKGSWICRGAVVGHASEIKNSILLPGSKAPHFNYVGDSILGIGANIGAGAKLSNVRNDRRGIIATLKEGQRIDTGLRKMGAIVGDGAQLGCNVVTNPGAIIEAGSMIPPNETISGWFGN